MEGRLQTGAHGADSLRTLFTATNLRKEKETKADNTICTVQYIDNDTDTPYSHRPWCLQLLVLMGGMDGDGDGASYTGAGIVFVRVYWGETSISRVSE